ncbi:MAG: hypothetical protein HOO67_01510 [Candidatus Peribacteraceae bacterium]|nr:hypothetical protein [Candidatus Peribacteraceae bacterium]
MNETKTFSIRVDLLPKVEARILRLNRRATRLGVSPITTTRSEPYLKEVSAGTERDENGVRVPKSVWLKFSDLTISLNIPKLADWSFVCTIQHTGAGNLLLTVPGTDVDLTPFRTCGPTCQHCNQSRNRLDTYVVRHASGEVKQVGRDCLANFTGFCGTPEQAAQQAQWLSECLSLVEEPCGEDGDEGWGCGSTTDGVGLDRFLSYVVVCSEKHGFRTRKQADILGVGSTKDDALFNMEPPQGVRGPFLTPTDEHRAFAKEARNWAANIDVKNDFDHNLKTVAGSDGVLYRNLGIAAYIIEAFRRMLGQSAERAARAESKHFGIEKERLRGLKLTYTGNYSFDSQYGVTFIHRFVTEDGNDAIWKTGSLALCHEGETVTVDATVKKHGDYKGRLQTELTRVKVAA